MKGNPVTRDKVIEEPVWRAVTREMARIHKIEVNFTTSRYIQLFSELRCFSGKVFFGLVGQSGKVQS